MSRFGVQECPPPLAISKALTLYLGNEVRTSQIRNYLRILRSSYPECDMDKLSELIAGELTALGVKVIDDLSGEIQRFEDGTSVLMKDSSVVVRKEGTVLKISSDQRVMARIYELVSEAKSGKDLLSLIESLENQDEELEWLKSHLRKVKGNADALKA
ncbi:MAG: hypothetical protein ACP5HQ_07335 [Thermoprotei archaeon]